MKLRNVEPLDVLFWVIVLCICAALIGDTIRGIVGGSL